MSRTLGHRFTRLTSLRANRFRPSLHRLEDRTTPTAVTWDGGASTLNWTDAKNWNPDGVPGVNDDVTCDPSGSQTVLYAGGASTIKSLILNDNLSLTSGTISVTGTLTVNNGAFIKATGAGVSFSAAGATSADAASFYALTGGSISLPGLTSFTGNPASYSFEPNLQANGTNSQLLLPNLTTFKGAGSNSFTRVRALAGGVVSMPMVPGYSDGNIEFKADGTSSKLDISALASMAISVLPASGLLYATNGGTLTDTALTTTDGVDLYLDGTGTMPISQITTFNAGHLRISGGTYDFSGLTNLDAGGAVVTGGKVTLSKLASYVGNPNQYTYDPYLQADGAGSQLNLSALTSMKGAGNQTVRVRATNGGLLSFPALTQFDTGYVEFKANGASSKLDMPVLAKIAAVFANNPSSLQATSSGNLNVPALTMIDSCDVDLDGTGTMPISQITQCTSAHLRISGGTYDFSGLTNLNGGGAVVTAGAHVTLSKLTSYVGNPVQYTYEPYFQADGSGSQLSAPLLASMKSAGNETVRVRATNGGLVSFAALTEFDTGYLEFKADGTGSKLDAPVLSKMTTVYPYSANLYATNSGNLNVPALTTCDGCNLYLNGTGIMPITQITQFTAGHLLISGGTYDFSGLTNLNAGGAIVSAGAHVMLSKLTSYVGNPVQYTYEPYLQADGSGSQLSAPLLASMKSAGNETVRVRATNGGLVSFAALTEFDTGYLEFKADGTGSKLDAPVLSKMTTVYPYSANLYATNSGNLNVPALTTCDGCNLYLNGTGTMPITQITQFTAGHLEISGGTYDFSGLTNLNAGGAIVTAGAHVTLSKLTSYVGNPTSFTFETFLTADGANSQLNLPMLTSFKSSAAETTRVRATNGGLVSLPALTQVDTYYIEFKADGAGSKLDMPVITKLTTAGASSPANNRLYATTSGNFNAPMLTTIDGCDLYLDGTSTMPISQITQFTTGHIRVSGGTYDFTGLTNLNAGGAVATTGGKITLSKVSSYVGNPNNFTFDPFLQADGATSQLNLSALTQIQGTGASTLRLRATNGGQVSAPLLAQINTGFTEVKSDGASSAGNLPALTSFSGSAYCALTASNSGVIHLPAAATITVANVVVSATTGGSITTALLKLDVGSYLDGNSLNGPVTGIGTVRPAGTGGSNTGVLAVSGNVSLLTGSTFETQINGTTAGTFDSMSVTGTVSLSETKLAPSFNFTPSLGNTVKIIDNDGTSDPVTGKFAGLWRNNYVATASNGLYWLVNYTAGDGNDVTLKAHPVAMQVEANVAQRSMVRTLNVLFSSPVTLGAAAFTLSPSTNITANVNIDGAGKNATITFTGSAIIGNSLPDGRYTLTINGSAITVQGTGLALDADADGAPGGSLPVDFHRLFGDSDGNGVVNTVDFLAFRSAFGGSSTIFSFNNTGSVSASDFLAFRSRFGSSV